MGVRVLHALLYGHLCIHPRCIRLPPFEANFVWVAFGLHLNEAHCIILNVVDFHSPKSITIKRKLPKLTLISILEHTQRLLIYKYQTSQF